MIPISEIFGPTIQGEGPRTGYPTIFVRVYGCNLECPWCIDQETEITLINGKTKKAKDLLIDEEILTPCGKTKIIKIIKRKVNRHYKITLENGKILRCSVDHPLVRSDGTVVKASNVKKGEILLFEA